MTRKTFSFLISMLGAVCILACCMVMPVFAADVDSLADKITVTADNTENLTVNGSTSGTYTIKVDDSFTTSWWQNYYTANTRTLTFTNNYPGWVKITYTLSSSNSTGSHQINDGTQSSDQQTDTITVQTGGTFTIKVVSSDNKSTKNATDTSNTVTFAYSIAYEPLTPDISFDASSNGTYTVMDADGSTVNVGDTANSSTYTLTASAASGYQFYRWVFTAGDGTVTYFGRYESSTVYTASEAGSITCEFVRSDAAMYSVNSVKYAYLDEAVTAAGSSGTIVLTGTGSVYGSKGQTDLEITSGVTLVLPYASGGTEVKSSTATFPYGNYAKNCEDNKYVTQPTALGTNVTYTLTIPGGTTVVNKGIIAVGGTLHGNAALNGTHSNLKIEKEGELRLTSDTSVLSAIGYVYGEGKVIANGSGAKIYQPFSLLRIGSSSWGAGAVGASMDLSWTDSLLGGMGMTGVPGGCYDGTNPSPRYCTQAIQCELTMEDGDYMYGYAEQHTYGSCYASTVLLIGKETDTNAQILLKSGTTLTSTYNSTKKNTTFSNVGKLTLTINGNGTGGAKQGSMSLTLKGYSIALSSWPFPVPYNYDLVLENGIYDLNYDLSLLPGAGLTVGEYATLNVNKSLAVFTGAYDHSSYGPTSANTITYGSKDGAASPTNVTSLSKFSNFVAPGGSTSSTMANLVVNGTMNVNGSLGGIVQTTGGGEIEMNGSTNAFTRQLGLVGKGKDATSTLYFAGATLYTFTPQFFDATGTLQTMETGKTYRAANTEVNNVDTFDFVFYSSSNYSDTSTIMNKTESVEAHPVGRWTTPVTITFDANEGTGTMEAQAVDSGVSTALKENKFTRENYSFTGWNTVAEPTEENPGTAYADGETINVSGDITLYAQWEAAGSILTLDPNYEGAEPTTVEIKEANTYGDLFEDGVLPTLTRTEEGKNYCFAGWFTEKENGNQVTAATKLDTTGTVTLYAHWNETHTAKKVASENPATCVSDGIKDHWTCEICGKLFSDEACTAEITDFDAWKADENGGLTPALGHDYTDAKVEYVWSDDNSTCTASRSCVREGCGYEETAEAKVDVNTTDPSCTAEGSTTITATFEGVGWAEEQKKEESIPTTGCNYSDKWTYDDTNHWHECSVCGEKSDEAPHADGDSNHKCDTCEYVMSQCSFTVEGDVKTAGDCMTATIYKAKCSVCGTVSDTVTITGEKDSSNHTGKNTTVVNAKDATCTVEGYTGDTVCECGVTVQAGETIPAKNHAWSVTYDWTQKEDGWYCTATRVCANDAAHKETATATITSAVKTPATCEAMGTTTYTATFDETWATTQTKDVVDIPATGHVNTTSNTVQKDDGKTHTTTVTCSCSHVVSSETANCEDKDNNFACDVCGGLLVNAYTDAVTMAEAYEGTTTVVGNTVTLKYTGDLKYEQGTGTDVWYNWVGFKITAPVDMSKITILRPDGATRNMYDIKDGANYAYLYWGMTENNREVNYQIDWNGDDTYDLTVILDATAANLLECEHVWDNGVETTPPTCTAAGEKTFTCANCDGTKIEEVAATGHVNTTTVYTAIDGVKQHTVKTTCSCSEVTVDTTADCVDSNSDNKCDNCERALYVVTIYDRTIEGDNKATTSLIPGGKYVPGETFTVTCAKACVVAISFDSGENYEELSCTAVSGEGNENTYQFTIPDDAKSDFKIGIVLRGDAIGEGAVNAYDVTRILRYINPGITTYNELDALTELAADATLDGIVNVYDGTRILRYINPGITTYNEVAWKLN